MDKELEQYRESYESLKDHLKCDCPFEVAVKNRVELGNLHSTGEQRGLLAILNHFPHG